jgi:hypothetical protein
MATTSIFTRPVHLIAVLWFLIHIPTTLLIDIQSGACVCGVVRRNGAAANRSQTLSPLRCARAKKTPLHI